VSEALNFAALGLAAGAYGAVIGAGGGFLMVPALLLLFGFPVVAAVGTSLLAVFCIGASASAGYALQRRVDFPTAAKFALGAVAGALGGTFLARFLAFEVFSGLLGGILFGLGVMVLRNPLAEAEPAYPAGPLSVRILVDSRGRKFAYRVDLHKGLLLSFGEGLVAALFGIGGGVIIVPAMIFLLKFPHQIAVSTSAVMLTVSSFVGAFSYAMQGAVQWKAAFPDAAVDRPSAERGFVGGGRPHAGGGFPGPVTAGGRRIARPLRG
jgi:uncharacterized membrane protein YfcA